MGHRMVLGYGDGLTILLWTMSNDRQVENRSYDSATTFLEMSYGRTLPRRGYFPQPGVGAQHLPRVGVPIDTSILSGLLSRTGDQGGQSIGDHRVRKATLTG